MVVDVALPVAVAGAYTYLVPDHLETRVEMGHRVLVPFGRRMLNGYILDIRREEPQRELKSIVEILDPFPWFPRDLIPFLSWISKYYMYPIGLVIRTALPTGLGVGTRKSYRLTPAGREAMTEGAADLRESAVLSLLKREGGCTARALAGKISEEDFHSVLRRLSTKGWIACTGRLSRDAVRPLRIKMLRAEPYPGDMTSRQEEIWKYVAQKPERPRSEVAERFPGCASTLRTMERKGILRTLLQDVYRNPFGEDVAVHYEIPELTADQDRVRSVLSDALSAEGFHSLLLHGVTGSGKTELYLRAVRETLERGRTALVMAPEITLAAQMEAVFRSRFGDRLALLHSGLSSGQRFDQWLRILKGEASVVLGVRSAVFAPLSRLGLIVVDEEHDQAYKQEDRLRYQARDLALVRGKMVGALVVLGSATPSLQSYHHAVRGKYAFASLPRRIGEGQLPEVQLVDMAQEKRGAKLSRILAESLEGTLDRREQVILLLNRRGYAPLLLCPNCRTTVQCANCQVALTLHRDSGSSGDYLLCHHCGYTHPFEDLCPVCGFHRLIPLGMGTEKLEETLAERFPSARIGRLDRDTVADRSRLFQVLRAFHSGEMDILVGTQMIAKGLDFPGVTLVGVLSADHSLHFPDFASTERTYQILSQVSGRAGRRESPGKVIIQTFHPDHYCLRHARHHAYHGFYLDELVYRNELLYPPFSRLAALRISSEDPTRCRDTAGVVGDTIKEQAAGDPRVRVLGPAPAPLGKLRGRYRWHLLIKGAGAVPLNRFLRRAWPLCRELGRRTSTSVSLDVDPASML